MDESKRKLSGKDIATIIVSIVAIALVVLVVLKMTGAGKKDPAESNTVKTTIIKKTTINEKGEVEFITMVEEYTDSGLHASVSYKPKTTKPTETDESTEPAETDANGEPVTEVSEPGTHGEPTTGSSSDPTASGGQDPTDEQPTQNAEPPATHDSHEDNPPETTVDEDITNQVDDMLASLIF